MSIGIGIIGTGVMGQTHVKTIQTQVPGAHVSMIWDLNPVSVQKILDFSRDVEVAADPTALIASETVDAVIIASPDETHADYLLKCLEASKPVLCEKPLAGTVASCSEIIAAEQSRDRQSIQVGFMRRFDPAYKELKSTYESGVVGPARLLRCIHRNAVAPSFFTGDMAITNAMVHEFDIVRWLLNTEISRIRVSGARQSPEEGLLDPLLATLETNAGQIVDIEVFMNAQYGYDIRTEIVGQIGTLELGQPTATAILLEKGIAQRFPRNFTERFFDSYRLQLQDWVTSLEARKTTSIGASAWDGYAAVAVAEAATKALRSQDWVEVELMLKPNIYNP